MTAVAAAASSLSAAERERGKKGSDPEGDEKRDGEEGQSGFARVHLLQREKEKRSAAGI